MQSLETIVYLHGFASGPGSRKAQYFRERFLESGHSLAIPDLAEGDFENLTITGQLRVVERLVGDRPAILIGSSMGGYLTALYAARHPAVCRVVLLAPAFGFAARWPESLGADLMAEWEQTGWRTVPHYGDKIERRLNYKIIEDGRKFEEYPDVRQRALLFHGRNDTVVPPSLSQTFAASRPNVTLEMLDSDHELTDVLPYLWERTRQFVLNP